VGRVVEADGWLRARANVSRRKPFFFGSDREGTHELRQLDLRSATE
jgi:hypothetical protein